MIVEERIYDLQPFAPWPAARRGLMAETSRPAGGAR